MTSRQTLMRRLASQEGFTMIIAIGVLLVTSLLMVAAFTVAEGEIQLSRDDTTKKQAYYASLAGIQQYEYLLQADPDYWETCKGVASTGVPGSESEHYVVTPVVAQSAPKGSSCNPESPATAMIQTTGPFINTFRVKSVGEVTISGARKAKSTIIATFGVTGFLDYVFYTNYETVDPGLYANTATEAGNKNCKNAYCTNAELAKGCEGKYHPEWTGKYNCPAINFLSGDEIEGPLHTNDTSLVSGSAIFGRKGHSPPDVIEMFRGSYGSASGCPSAVATYYTATKCYIKEGEANAQELVPPPDDESLGAYVEPEYDFEGAVKLELKGNEMAVTYHDSAGTEHSKTMKFPPNGLIYVQGNKEHACGFKFEVENSDTASEWSEEKYCGNVYVTGEYSKSLTIAGSDDVIVQKNVFPQGLSSLGSKPGGTDVLGLIAGEYVRYYHACSGGTNSPSDTTNPWVYAGILATSHSWTVDNHSCGPGLGNINVYGAIGQDYRGVVYNGGSGYVKNYEYDDRLATNEPPYFLAPLKAGWKIVRETSPTAG